MGRLARFIHFFTEDTRGKEPPKPKPKKYTVTGVAPITLVNAVAKKIQSLTQYGKCAQSGTPTPSEPVDIVCNNGTLKFSPQMANVNSDTALVGYYISSSGVVAKDANNWIYQYYIPVKPSTKYTLSVDTALYYVTISEYSSAVDSGFIRRNAGSTGGNTSLTITTRSNTQYIRFGANIKSEGITIDDVLAIKWMLNKGDTALPYAPFVEGGIYADGTPEVLTVSGKNLFNAAHPYKTGYSINASGLETETSSHAIYIITAKAGESYTYSCSYSTGSSTTRIHTYDADGNWIRQETAGAQNATKTFTTPVNTAEIRVSMAVSAADTAQVELGPSATDFAAYTAQTVTNIPNLFSTLDGSVRDEVDLVSGVLTRRTEAVYEDGAIVIKALDEPITEHTTPQNLHTAAGTNVVSVTAEVSGITLEAVYMGEPDDA